jgi:type II secretion system protein C
MIGRLNLSVIRRLTRHRMAPACLSILLAVAILGDIAVTYRSVRSAPMPGLAAHTPAHGPPLRALLSDSSAIVNAHLFGLPAIDGATLSVPVTGSLKLTGTIVWEGQPDRGYAFLGPTEQQAHMFGAGMEVAAGTRLFRVFRDHVTLERDGGYLTVRLPRKAQSSGASRESDDGSLLATDEAFRVNNQAAQRFWSGLSARPVVENDAFRGYAVSPLQRQRRLYGLRPGDIVTHIDGVALDEADSAAAQLDKIGSSAISLTVQRDGVEQQLNINVNGS